MNVNATRRLAAAAALVLLAGCAATALTSVRDPAFQGRTFQRIVVVAPFTDLDKRATAENSFVAALQARGAQAVPAMTVLPPTRTYSDEEMGAALRAAGADGVLLVTLTDAYASTTYVPGSTTTSGSAYATGSTVSWTATTRQNPGYYVNKPRVRFEVKLVDVATGSTAWLGTSLTRGNAFAGWDTLMRSLASEAAGRLAADGLVR